MEPKSIDSIEMLIRRVDGDIVLKCHACDEETTATQFDDVIQELVIYFQRGTHLSGLTYGMQVSNITTSHQPFIISTNRSNMYMLSHGPGEASEWYWIVSSGSREALEPLDGAIVQVLVADLYAVRQAFAVDRVAVVL